MKVEMLIVAVFIIIIGFSIVTKVLPKEEKFANEITLPENNTVTTNELDDQNVIDNSTIIENAVDVQVFN